MSKNKSFSITDFKKKQQKNKTDGNQTDERDRVKV